MYFLSKKMVIIILATYSKKLAIMYLYTLLTAVKYPEIQLDTEIIGRATAIKYTILFCTLLCKHFSMIKFLFKTKNKPETAPNNKLIKIHFKTDFFTPLSFPKLVSSEIIRVVVILIPRSGQSNSK